MNQPCLRVQQLIQQAQAIIDANMGVTGEELRDALGIKLGYFKLVSPYLRCHKQRHTGYQYTYYPIGAIVAPNTEKPPEHSTELLATVEKIQAFIDKHAGVTDLQIRIEVGIDIKFFKKCVRHIKAIRAKNNGVTVYYTKAPAAVKIREEQTVIEMPAGPPRTRWVNVGS